MYDCSQKLWLLRPKWIPIISYQVLSLVNYENIFGFQTFEFQFYEPIMEKIELCTFKLL